MCILLTLFLLLREDEIPKQVDSIVIFLQEYVLFTFYNISCLQIYEVVANKNTFAFLPSVLTLQNDGCFMFLFVTFSIDKYHLMSSLNSKESHSPKNLTEFWIISLWDISCGHDQRGF